MSRATRVLEVHHKHCDEAFADAEEAVARGRWADAAGALELFHGEMERHFQTEESVLFPAYEAATGENGGPTAVMRQEHAQMRGLMEAMSVAARARDGNGYAGHAETLLIMMQQHNMKEENILYPMCDRALADKEIGAALAARLAA